MQYQMQRLNDALSALETTLTELISSLGGKDLYSFKEADALAQSTRLLCEISSYKSRVVQPTLTMEASPSILESEQEKF